MGANLVPKVRNFAIDPKHVAQPHEIDDGCITPGTHRVLQFDFLSQNVGDADFVVGRPVDNQALFEYSASHQHYHMKQFNKYSLYDASGNLVVPSKKPGFCLADVEPVLPNYGPAKFPLTCKPDEVMGISAGYYTLIASTNTARAVAEDNFDDNTVCQGLHLVGDNKPEMVAPPVAISLAIPNLSFFSIPEGETTVRAATFDVRSCGAVHFEIASGPTVLTGPPGTTFGSPLGTTVAAPEVQRLILAPFGCGSLTRPPKRATWRPAT